MMTPRRICFSLILFVAVLCAIGVSRVALARDPAGAVDRVQGDAFARFGEGARVLAVGAPVFVGDHIVTKTDTRVRLRMNDGAEITLGENSVLIIEPREEDTRLPVFQFLRGALLAITGAVNDLGRKGMTINTPDAVLGVRGTTVWGGQSPGHLAVVMLEGSEVLVETASGSVALNESSFGTDVYEDKDGPTPPKVWPEQRVEAALSSVVFSDDD